MKPGSILEQRLADHLLALLERMRAGCLVLPASGIPEALAQASNPGALRRLVCLDGRHAVTMARGHAAASGKVGVAVIRGGSKEIAGDLVLAGAERSPLVVLVLDGEPLGWLGADSYVAGSRGDALALMAYAIARARTGAMPPVCVHLRAGLLEVPLQLQPHHHDIERTTGFAADEKCPAVPEEALQALIDAERTLLLVGSIAQDSVIRRKLTALAAALGVYLVLDPLDTSQPLRALSQEAPMAALVDDADLVIGLNSERLADLLALASATARAMVIHVSDAIPEPSSSSSGHLVPVVDIHLRMGPEAAVSELLDRLTEGTAELASGISRQVEILRGVERGEDFGDSGVQPVSGIGRRASLAPAVGAAAAIADTGRQAVLRLTAAELLPDVAALWTLQHAGIAAILLLDPERPGRGKPDIVALIRSFGIRVQTRDDDPGSASSGPVVRIGRTASGEDQHR